MSVHERRSDSEITERRLLQSTVEVARHVFSSAAASVFLVDQDTGDLIFEAVSGEGEQHLVGTRFAAGTGIAGWVAASGQPMIADEVAAVPQFAQDAAESTGYVPRSIMAAPVIREESCIGVLEVLDRSATWRGTSPTWTSSRCSPPRPRTGWSSCCGCGGPRRRSRPRRG
ncbi:hypothetical protein GCM10027612_08370 [Microbispora bryophytorum subsp. camponoti]